MAQNVTLVCNFYMYVLGGFYLHLSLAKLTAVTKFLHVCGVGRGDKPPGILLDVFIVIFINLSTYSMFRLASVRAILPVRGHLKGTFVEEGRGGVTEKRTKANGVRGRGILVCVYVRF